MIPYDIDRGHGSLAGSDGLKTILALNDTFLVQQSPLAMIPLGAYAVLYPRSSNTSFDLHTIHGQHMDWHTVTIIHRHLCALWFAWIHSSRRTASQWVVVYCYRSLLSKSSKSTRQPILPSSVHPLKRLGIMITIIILILFPPAAPPKKWFNQCTHRLTFVGWSFVSLVRERLHKKNYQLIYTFITALLKQCMGLVCPPFAFQPSDDCYCSIQSAFRLVS